MADADTNVKVWGRIRPLKPTERRSCMTVDLAAASITLNARPTAQKFTLDGVLTPDGAQVELFEKTAKPITDACMLGFNGTIFAYGQTGSGKTHTILGPSDAADEQRGLLPRVFEYLFSSIRLRELKEGGDSVKHLCKCSFIEIYSTSAAGVVAYSSSSGAVPPSCCTHTLFLVEPAPYKVEGHISRYMHTYALDTHRTRALPFAASPACPVASPACVVIWPAWRPRSLRNSLVRAAARAPSRGPSRHLHTYYIPLRV
jgi:hypothetical protein